VVSSPSFFKWWLIPREEQMEDTWLFEAKALELPEHDLHSISQSKSQGQMD
jgi:hypothetical protein